MPGGISPSIDVLLSWPQPNFINPERKPNTITVLSCIFGPLTVVLFAIRLWVRVVHQRKPGWDDWVMLAAMVPTIVSTVLTPVGAAKFFNRHVWDFDIVNDPKGSVTARKYILAQLCTFCLASGLIKISILLFYRRLSSRVVSKTFRWTTWITIAFIAGYTIALIIAPIVGCQPISAFWDQLDIGKRLRGYEFHCFDEGADIFAASVLSAAQDLVTAVLPTFLYWNLKIPLQQKMALFSIFGLGYGVVALGGLRCYYTWRTYYETYDVTWSSWDLFLVSVLELHVGAFCANAPTLKVFFQHFFHAKLTSYSSPRTPKDSKGRKDSANSGSNSSKGIFGKVASFLSTSHSNSDYISEPHNSVSVDQHGGVQVQKEFQVKHAPSTTSCSGARQLSVTSTDRIYDQYYHEDMELGVFTASHNSHVTSTERTHDMEDSNVSALPSMLKSPGSFRSMARQPSKGNDLSQTGAPGTTQEETGRVDGKRVSVPTPFLSRTLSKDEERPNWQTWK